MTNKSIHRDQLLGGLPGPKASVSLFAIESRVAQLVELAHQETAATYQTPAVAEQRERAFLDAIASGRGLPIQPSIQDIEHYAPQWSVLAPQDSGVRAALAQLLGRKYRFTRSAVPQLRQVLGLDDPAVRDAYQRLYGHPLETIYAPQVGVRERLHWAWTAFSGKLEGIPPFWMAFFLTLPGATGLLAMPIALANVGLSTALAMLVVFGLINMLTAAMMAESAMRSGTTHFGLGFMGPLVYEYLGSAASGVLAFHNVTSNFFVLGIFYLGVAGTLHDATGLPVSLWMAAHFLICLYFLTRRSLNATVSTTLLLVFVIMAILIIIPLLALPYFNLRNLSGIQPPFVGVPFTSLVWGAALGIMSNIYYSHAVVTAYAPAVLRRASDGRAWIRGCVASIFAFMLLACTWEVVLNGSLSPAVLANTSGTSLSPLAALVGPEINWLGSVLVVLSLGLAAIQFGLMLYFVADDMLPRRGSRGFVGRMNERSRFLLAIVPVFFSFLFAEWVTLSGFASFTTLLSIMGALQLPLLGGVYPVLLLLVTRRKGDLTPRKPWGWLGSPLLLVGLYLVFLGIILVHGLFIWQDWIPRLLALAVALSTLWMTVRVLQGGALNGRVVVELREDRRPQGRMLLQVVQWGRPVALNATLAYPSHRALVACGDEIPDPAALQSIWLDIPANRARQLKVWAHRLAPEGRSEPLPLLVEVQTDGKTGCFDLTGTGSVTLDIAAWPCSVRLSRVQAA